MDERRLTPMLTQYRQIKARFPDALVLFRLGDFYETFEADAKIAAHELELVLTSRSFAKGVRLPMAGVPHHHVQSYIAKLIEKGYKVALVEQLEDPKKVKRLVKRDVIRVITPGTVVEDALLRAENGNYLVAIVRSTPPPTYSKHGQLDAPPETFGLAIADISTGEFATTQIQGADAQAKLLDELQRLQPSEYLLPASLVADADFCAHLKAIRPARISAIEDRVCIEREARRELCEHFGTATLDPFGCEGMPLAIAAANAVLQYLKQNQPTPALGLVSERGRDAVGLNRLVHLNQLWTYSLADYMTLDAATRRNLELTAPIYSSPVPGDEAGARNGIQRSLFGVLDRTVTAMGARMLKRWLTQPLLDLAQIHARLDAVEDLVDDAFLRNDLRQLLDGLYDVERLVGRIGFGNANARDLIALKRTLVRLPQIKARLTQTRNLHAHPSTPLRFARPERSVAQSKDAQSAAEGAIGLLQQLEQQLDELSDVAASIDHAIVDDPPIFIKEGGLIKAGYDAALDELRRGAAGGKKWLAELEEKEKQRTGIKNLRIRYNEVFGFFIEVPRSQGHLIPKHYERRASISHADRFVTPELASKEASILATEDRVKDLEYELFVDVRREVARHSARLQAAARILAQIDALASLAETAARFNYTKPLVDDGDEIEIVEGRHPVVERFMREGEAFVPNDARLDNDSQRVIVLTGPNMSGKSVFVRQVALIVLLAQAGSFVPASFAHIGLTDRIFTRIGASDDIAQGRSTFLVEMSETSHILRHATPRSLIVLDEVGRGTSTYDGISLAWAIAEEIHNVVGSKTLFATHYHELTELESSDSIRAHGSAVKNYTMAVQDQGNEVIFLRQVVPGGAEKSFGIHVARLAGLPERVIERAEQVLVRLEESRQAKEPGRAASRETGKQGDRETRSRSEKEYEIVTGDRPIVSEEGMAYDARAQVWRAILEQIADVDIVNMTPIQALVFLNELRSNLKANE